jgi:hypothetical protein
MTHGWTPTPQEAVSSDTMVDTVGEVDRAKD